MRTNGSPQPVAPAPSHLDGPPALNSNNASTGHTYDMAQGPTYVPVKLAAELQKISRIGGTFPARPKPTPETGFSDILPGLDPDVGSTKNPGEWL
jgi:hypothetical protein